MKSLNLILFCYYFNFILCSSSTDYSCLHAGSWLYNSNSDYSSLFSSNTDITTSIRSSGVWSTTTKQIPKYDHTFTTSDITTLNSRPKASTDFTTGSTTAVAGTTYSFGTNIGYKTTSCAKGYWPPGPSCPSATTATNSWDLTPAPETNSNGCYFPYLGKIGSWVNGVAIYGTSDGISYNSQSVWYNLAPEFEVYDLDICHGHAANGQYHHHHYPICLGERLGEDGSTHSKIWGWMLDGYPIYGPYQSANTLAVSCWQKRDYSSTSATGCSDSKRSCQLNNQYDYTLGTKSVTSGPSLTGTVSTQSGNTISAASGIYFEDYFYNSSCSARGDKYLDSHAGHSHEPMGYHYHVTITSTGTATFPYVAGPKYYGCRSQCCSSRTSNTCTGTSTCGTADGTTSYSCSSPTISSTSSPTKSPTLSPSKSPSISPTKSPSVSPTINPSIVPSKSPTLLPSKAPSITEYPTTPTYTPSLSPTLSPTITPTRFPSNQPTKNSSNIITSKSSDESNSNQLQNNLIIGLSVGIGGAILIGGLIFVYFEFFQPKRKLVETIELS